MAHTAEISKSKGARFVRFYPSDWRSGCLGMTLEQQGLYVAICAFQWETGRRLFENDTQAAHALGLNPKNYRKVRDQLVQMGKIEKHEDGYANARAETELNAALGAGSASRRQSEETDLGTARDVHQECQNGGDQASERSAGPHPVVEQPAVNLETIPDQSPVNLGSIVDQSSILMQKGEQNQCSLIEPIADSHSHKEKNPPTPKGASKADCLAAFEAYNATALRCGLAQAAKFTPDRERKIRARLNDYGLTGWEKALANIERSSFLTGKNDKGWRANLEFMTQAESFSKLHDGVYGNGRHGQVKAKQPAYLSRY